MWCSSCVIHNRPHVSMWCCPVFACFQFLLNMWKIYGYVVMKTIMTMLLKIKPDCPVLWPLIFWAILFCLGFAEMPIFLRVFSRLWAHGQRKDKVKKGVLDKSNLFCLVLLGLGLCWVLVSNNKELISAVFQFFLLVFGWCLGYFFRCKPKTPTFTVFVSGSRLFLSVLVFK